MRAVLSVRLQAVDDALALQHADRVPVERDVDGGRPALDLAVVVDRLDALRGRGLLDRGGGARVDRRDDQDLGTVRQALVRLRALLLRITLRVDDRVADAGCLERLRHRRTIELLPADRRLRIREQETDVRTRLLLAGAARRRRDDDGQPDGCDDGRERRRPAKELAQRFLLIRLIFNANPPDRPSQHGADRPTSFR